MNRPDPKRTLDEELPGFACSVSDLYCCQDCKHSDLYGRGCDCGPLFQLLLIMAGQHRCPNLELIPKTHKQRKALGLDPHASNPYA